MKVKERKIERYDNENLTEQQNVISQNLPQSSEIFQLINILN